MAVSTVNHSEPTRTPKERTAAAMMMQRLLSAKDVRKPKVRRLRAAIRRGIYENELKQQVAIDRLIGEMTAFQVLNRITP